MTVIENLQNVRRHLAEVSQKASRSPESVTLIAVSKTKPIELIEQAYEAGQRDFGENRVQELRDKQPLLPEVRWHMIGNLQRNKVKYIAPFIHLIHSVSSEKLLREIDKEAEKNDRIISCLLELHISGEESKSGMDEAEAQTLLEKLDAYPNVRIIGLMGMAEFTDDTKRIRSQFRRLREASERYSLISHPRITMQELSMGMSGDYEIAIEEGATMVRIGSAIFGARNYT